MQIGAHYYPWYKDGQRWKTKTARYYHRQKPSLGWYNNVKDCEVIKQQFQTCKQYGIDFLLISQFNEDLLLYLDIAEEIGIKITAHCETVQKTKKHLITKKEQSRLLFDTPRLADWMKHPAWLHFNEKPVIAYYVTRQIQTEILADTISKMRECFGECFLLGDEVWWTTPQKERLELFDAIYSYNMYINTGDKMDRGKVCSKGETGIDYLNLIAPYEKSFYKTAHDIGIKFFPTVLPGYNDRAVRYDVDHYVIPRMNGDFFNAYLTYAEQFVKDDVLLVTSFNEWYEDTQIESAIQDTVVIEDQRDLLQGIVEESYETRYLEKLLSFKKDGTKRKRLQKAALLYYQTTIVAEMNLKMMSESELQKEYFLATEKALQAGVTVEEIRQHAYLLVEDFIRGKQNVSN